MHAPELVELKQTNSSLTIRLEKAELAVSLLEAECSRLKTIISQFEVQSRSLRFDLDGQRLTGPDKKEVWLVIQGRRRKCYNADVYCSLFSDTADLSVLEDPDQVELGTDLGPGTCLVQSISDGVIFLAVAGGDKCVLHRVACFEAFTHYGFNIDKVIRVPAILLDSCLTGRTLSIL